VLGTLERIGRMQRRALRVLQIFEDHGGLEDRGVADQQHRRLAERGDLQEPVRLAGEIDVDAFERHALLGERDHGALHIGAELVADERQLGHGECRPSGSTGMVNAFTCI
jgi:hypothetical protein